MKRRAFLMSVGVFLMPACPGPAVEGRDAGPPPCTGQEQWPDPCAPGAKTKNDAGPMVPDKEPKR